MNNRHLMKYRRIVSTTSGLLIDERQKRWQRKVMQTLVRSGWIMIFALVALGVGPATARADRLFTGDGRGNNLYEIDTSAGGWSKIVICDQVNCVNGLSADAHGNLYESDFNTRSIRKFTMDGKYHTIATLDSPSAVMAFDREGNLFIPYQGQWGGDGRIDKFSPDGSTSSTFATDLPQPVALIFDAQGTLYCTDQKSGCIYQFDPYDGTRTTFATGLKSPIGMAFDAHGIMFVADPSNRSIYKYTTNGVRTFFTRRLRTGACSLAFDSKGNLFVSDGSGNIYEFKQGKEKLSTKPVLVASGMGHNYFMAIVPGSMPKQVLISMGFSQLMAMRWVHWTLASAGGLLVAFILFLLRRKISRPIISLVKWTGIRLGGFGSQKTNRILAGLWGVYCVGVGFSLLFRLLDERFVAGNSLLLYLRAVLCPIYLAGGVVSYFLFRGVIWARKVIGFIAWISLATTLLFVFLEHAVTVGAVVGGIFSLASALVLQFSKPVAVPRIDFNFLCPQCGQHILGNSGNSGRRVQCPVCQLALIVPQAPAVISARTG